jgi:hypothetical protein
MRRGARAAGTRAAHAGLTPARDWDFDRYLLIEDHDDVSSEIRTLLQERFPRRWEPVL